METTTLTIDERLKATQIKSVITHYKEENLFEITIGGKKSIEIKPTEWRKWTLQLIALSMDSEMYGEYPEINSFILEMDTFFRLLETESKKLSLEIKREITTTRRREKAA